MILFFRKSAFVVLLLFLLSATVFSQTKHTLSGYVRDGGTGEDLASAQVLVPSAGTGAYTNTYGFFSLTLAEGEYDVVVRYLSYVPDTIHIQLNQDLSQNFELLEKSVEVQTVEITDKASADNVQGSDMSVETMNLKEIRKLPAFMGEVEECHFARSNCCRVWFPSEKVSRVIMCVEVKAIKIWYCSTMLRSTMLRICSASFRCLMPMPCATNINSTRAESLRSMERASVACSTFI